MWDDIVIGKGETGITTIREFHIVGDHHISHNNVCYRIGGDLLIDVGMTIMKYTKEGQKLTAMIEKNQPLDKIIDYLNGVMLRKIKLDMLKKKIDQLRKESFEAGKHAKQIELQIVLGIYD